MRAFKMTIRFKPSRAEDARVLEYLQGADCSYSKAVVNAINGYLDAQEKENREDSFLGRVRMMLREELKSIGNGTPFQPTATFPQQPREDNAALAFLDAFDGME